MWYVFKYILTKYDLRNKQILEAPVGPTWNLQFLTRKRGIKALLDFLSSTTQFHLKWWNSLEKVHQMLTNLEKNRLSFFHLTFVRYSFALMTMCGQTVWKVKRKTKSIPNRHSSVDKDGGRSWRQAQVLGVTVGDTMYSVTVHWGTFFSLCVKMSRSVQWHSITVRSLFLYFKKEKIKRKEKGVIFYPKIHVAFLGVYSAFFGVFLKYYMFCFSDIDWLNGALLSDLQPQLPPRGSWYRGQGTIHRAFIPPAIYPPFIYPPLPSPLIPHPSNHHTMVFRNQVYQEFKKEMIFQKEKCPFIAIGHEKRKDLVSILF